MRYAWAISVALAACYQPTASSGAPCGPSGECPTGLECINNRCLPPGTASDDAATIEDASVDTSGLPADAAADTAIGYVPWGTPVEIVSLETPGSGETDPTMSANRLAAVVATGTVTDDLYYCTRAAVTDAFTCSALTTLTSTSTEKSPELSADGSTLYFASNRSGNHDIYIAAQIGGVWSLPTVVTQLSSASSESDIAISPDGLTAAVLRNASPNHILIATRSSTTLPFGTPVVHSELEVTSDIAAPTITNGGDIIYFHGGATRDIYASQRKGNGMYTPPSLVTELNTAGRDAAPFVSADDKYLVFEREGNIYETSRP
jgi:hypothetical protein